MLTFMSRVKNFLLIGSNGNLVLGQHWTIHDVVTDSLHTVSGFSNTSDIDAQVLKIAKHPDIKNPDGSIVPNIQSSGWKNDANKNLPGLKKLYETYPDANWFMMIDDDTYVFVDNLVDYLSTLDPQTPYYIGRANSFVGCAGIVNHGDGPEFAHGGSGYVVSKKAMSMLLDGYNACIEKHSSCWAGDIRVALW
ncbi:UNVERIFIED_CONTAM: hypothetical protein HDU68_012227 [Siphonaria sp. JEL0065]|nr:hypothetical protein HDU68_012227 [Siphonaria sp. JEL0065]